jgi:hypothetical protein
MRVVLRESMMDLMMRTNNEIRMVEHMHLKRIRNEEKSFQQLSISSKSGNKKYLVRLLFENQPTVER